MPDQKGGGQTGAAGRGEGIDVQRAQVGLPEGLFDQGTEDEGVIAGGHFRNDPTVGTMQGSYQMVAADGQQFAATIPEFVLSAPRTLH